MSLLPTGTVTFLFTDIEGSTRKWQNWPHKMKTALKRHDDILQMEIENSGGWVFKTVGDAFCAAFHTAMDCINCVLSIQKIINEEPWDLPEQIKVRMSIHTGEAIERNNDYYGPALNRVARLEAITSGGQILMSLVTAELIRDMLSEPMSIKFMGDHRLKDLTRSEGVYQLIHPDLQEEFPPIKSLDSHPHNLSVMPTLLIGRSEELKTLQELVLNSASRVITVTGPGGMGKTRISLQIAAELIEHFRNGVFFVDLTKINNADAFYQLLLSTLSIKESGGKESIELLIEYLKEKNILLILDNFEHLMDAAVLAADLLAECPGLKYLVTSREALHLRGEKIFQLPPLNVPSFKNERPPSLKKLNQYDSVRLFIERALDVNEDFTINNINAPAIAQICIQLDGIPLAIELAAARITTLSPKAILKRLNHSLELLTLGAADLPDRQQTLRSTIDWSFNLLDNEMKDLFMSLAIFRGGFDLEAVEAVVVGRTQTISSLDGIEHLLEKSLIVKKDQPDGEPWFSMLETIHEYAIEQLEKKEYHTLIQEKYSEYYYRMVIDSENKIQSIAQKKWIDRLTKNTANIQYLLNLYKQINEVEKFVHMSGSLRIFWEISGSYSSGIKFYQMALNKEIKNIHHKNKIVIGLGSLLQESGKLHESLDIFERYNSNFINYRNDRLLLMYYKGWVFFRLNQFEKARELFNQIIEMTHSDPDEILNAKSIWSNAMICLEIGDMDSAEDLQLKSLALSKRINEPRSIAQATNNLGVVYYQKGNFELAKKYFEEALNIFVSIGDLCESKKLLNNLGYINVVLENYIQSIKLYKDLIKISRNDEFYLGSSYSGLSEIYFKLKQLNKAYKNSERAREIFEYTNYELDYAISLRIQGDILCAKKDYPASEECYLKALPLLIKNKEDQEVGLVDIALKNLRKYNSET